MSWSTLFVATNGTASGGNGYTRRIIIAAGSLAGTATTVRVLFHYSGTGSYTITDAYIGLKATSGDPYDIDPATIIRLQQGGSNTITVTSGAVYSDSVSLVVDGTRDIVVSLYGGTALHYLAGTVPSGLTTYHRSGNYASVADATSFTISTSNLLGFRGLEGEQLDSYTSSGSFSLPFFSVNGLAESTSVSASGSFSLPALSVNGNGEQGSVPSVINGHPWCQQYAFNDNASTSFSWNWVASDNGTALSTDGGMFLTNGRVYFILGDTTGNVFYNTIGEDGVVNPVRVNVSSLPTPRKGFGVFLTKNKVFLIGGQKYDSGIPGWIPAAEILSNTINTDGSIGSSWSTETLTLGGDRSYHSFALTKNNVYCMGGASYYGGTKSAGCLPIAIGSDGALGSLSGSTYNMLEAAAQTAYIDLDTKLYILGNNNRYVQQSTIADTGLIGAWSWASSIPYEVSNQGITAPGILVTSGNIFIIGGYRTGVGWSSDIITAPLSGTTIGTYSLLGTVPNTPLAGPFVFTTSSRLYVVCSGGYCYSSFTGGANNYLDKSYSADTPAGVSATGQVSLPLLAVNGQAEYTWFDHWKGNFNLKPFSVNGYVDYSSPDSGTIITNAQPWCQQYSFSDHSGYPSSWPSSAYIPQFTPNSSGFTWGTDSKIFYCTGLAYYVASINSATGAMSSSFSYVGDLPATKTHAVPALTKNRLYLIGGRDINGDPSRDIFTAPVNPDGTIGSWSIIADALPSGITDGSVAITKNYIYYLGGYTTTAVSSIFYANISPDGIIGTWAVHANSLDRAVSRAGVVVTSSHITLVGGLLSTGLANSLSQHCSINGDGTIGAWSLSGYSFATGQQIGASLVVYNSRVFAFGGSTDTSSLTDNLATAGIVDGIVGDFSTYSTSDYHHDFIGRGQVFATSANIYGFCQGQYLDHTPVSGGVNNYQIRSYIAGADEPVYATGNVSFKPFTCNGHATQGVVSYTASGSFRLKCFSVNGSATHPWTAYGNYKLPGIKIMASGPIDGRFNLPLISVNASFSFPFNTVGSYSLPSIKVSGVAEYTMPIVARGEISLPLISVSGKAHNSISAYGSFKQPLFSARGTFYSSFVSDGRYSLPIFTVMGSAAYAVDDMDTIQFERDEVIAPITTTSSAFEILQFVRG